MSTTEEEKAPLKVPTPPLALEAMQKLASIDEEQVARIGESVFINRVLPIFVTPGGDLSVWMEFTGSLQRPIDVIDKEGVILFRCPPPLRALPTSTHHTRSNSFNEIVQRTEAMHQQHPMMGLRYFEEMAARRANDYITTDVPERQQWLQIMARYGYVPDSGERAEAPAESSGGSIFSDEDEPL